MKLINKILCASLIAMPLIANAGHLKITNDSKYDLSFKVDNICSDAFGNVNSKTIKIVSEAAFKKACVVNPNFCVLTVYNKANCKGKNFIGLGFDTETGMSSFIPGSNFVPMTTSISAFDISFKSPV